MKHKTIQS